MRITKIKIRSAPFVALLFSMGLIEIHVTRGATSDSSKIASREFSRVVHTTAGAPGGNLIVAQRSELKTLNPVVALDAPSREVMGRMNADLIEVNRHTQRVEPALAESWSTSADGRHYVVKLRQGLRFSDGVPFDSDDVLFSFQVYLDKKLNAPQRDLLIVHGLPLQVKKIDRYTVTLDFADTYAGAERLLDGIPILPKHLLQKAYADGSLATAWGLNTRREEIAGMGPFRLKRYEPGQQITLERNPYYWEKDEKGQRLPYLDEIKFVFAGSEDGQVARFLSGEADLVNRLGTTSFRMLRQSDHSGRERLDDLGPGLDSTMLTFNFAVPVFRETAFRRAVSIAIDREAIARIAYGGLATPLAGSVTPANKIWRNESLAVLMHSANEARKTLSNAGFRWGHDGKLLDREGKPVHFSILAATNNKERLQTATLIQYDLGEIGIDVQIVALEFRAMVDRVTRTRQFEACILSLGGGDGDPNSELNVWLSSGAMHFWSPDQIKPATPWEAEIDDLMTKQMCMLDHEKRKQMYDRVQAIVAEQQPIISLVSPHVLVASNNKVVNFQPAVLESHTLWNADVLAVSSNSGFMQ